jgi:hypothetical protein
MNTGATIYKTKTLIELNEDGLLVLAKSAIVGKQLPQNNNER